MSVLCNVRFKPLSETTVNTIILLYMMAFGPLIYLMTGFLMTRGG
jgi:hypothetical protein